MANQSGPSPESPGRENTFCTITFQKYRIIKFFKLISRLAQWSKNALRLEFGLYRSLGGLCENEYYLVLHPLEKRNSCKKWSCKSHEKFLVRLLMRLARPGLARPCSDISRVNHTRPLSLELFGALQTSEPLRVLRYIRTYIRTYGLKFLAITGLLKRRACAR